MLIVFAVCSAIVGAQRLNSRLLKQKTYNSIFILPTKAERQELYAKLMPTQKAEIWRNDLLVKIKVRESEGTEKGKILHDLSDALFPDLFDADKTRGKPQTGEFAETPEAKRFFEAVGRYTNAFSPEESKLICGILGDPTNPADEESAKDTTLDFSGCFWLLNCSGTCS